MIKIRNQVPSIYPNASRDFQYLGWLFDIVLNSVKHNVDDLYNLPIIDSNIKLTELLALTLGFKVKRNYDQKQLAALVSVLPTILKYKGTEKAIITAGRALIKAAGAEGSFDCSIDSANAQLRVIFPAELVDTTLFTDLLDYILPAGMTCRVVRSTQDNKDLEDIQVGFQDTVHFGNYTDLGWNRFTNVSSGLSSLFNLDDTATEFAANFKQTDYGIPTLNAGLLSNTVIPVLSPDAQTLTDDELMYINMVDYDYQVLISGDGRILLAKEPPEQDTESIDNQELK